MSLKWRDIRLKVGEFCRIYHNLERIHRSGSIDFDVYTAALDQYKKTTATRRAFPYQELKDHLEAETISGSKRSRNDGMNSQTPDGRTFIDINDETGDSDQPMKPEDYEGEDFQIFNIMCKHMSWEKVLIAKEN
ncbi:hypothetical protein LXL04_023235 [Taraxacum kok-saghyz]